jgi:hypothetical protein
MPIVKSLKTKSGYSHRVHRTRKNRKPSKKYDVRNIRPYLELLKRKAEKREPDV